MERELSGGFRRIAGRGDIPRLTNEIILARLSLLTSLVLVGTSTEKKLFHLQRALERKER